GRGTRPRRARARHRPGRARSRDSDDRAASTRARPVFFSSSPSRAQGNILARGAPMNRRVYLDHNASTPVHPEVVQAMLPYFEELYGNPSSVHSFGREARDAVETARAQITQFLRVGKDEVVFTSGGTESDNFAVKGVAMTRREGHIITSQIEHHAVLRACQYLETLGFTVSYVPVDGHGLVDPDEVRRQIRPDTMLISIMHANSEVGTIEPIREIGQVAREREIPFHVDAVQTFGQAPIDVDAS